MLERIQFCNSIIDGFVQLINKEQNGNAVLVEKILNFESALRDFEKARDIIHKINSGEKPEKSDVIFLKTTILDNIKKMAEHLQLCISDSPLTEGSQHFNFERMQNQLREVNDCGIEVLILPE
jgi:hypothetical protein